MKVVRTREQAHAAVTGHGTVGLVPTMGYLHDGHLSLVRLAREQNDMVAVSIFVNPRQFGPNEDLDSYPRDLDRDLALLEAEGVDVAWVPREQDVYPPGFATRVELDTVAERLEGARRQGHFGGVATVVTVLLGVARPDHVYLGQKDAQQVVVIRQLISDLALPGTVVVGPTQREPDGVAMSSRNVYLDDRQRAAASVLHRALRSAEEAWVSGQSDAHALRAAVWAVLRSQDEGQVEYVSVGDPDSLEELDLVSPDRGALISTVVRFGRTRLLDNVLLHPRQAPGPGAGPRRTEDAPQTHLTH